jgi:restriction system protein
MHAGERQRTTWQTWAHMGRRRKKEDFVDILIELPWQVAAGFAVAGFIGFRWIIPSTLPPLLKGVGVGLQGIAWLPLIFFGFLSLISFARSTLKSGTPVVESGRFNAPQRRRAEPTIVQPLNKSAHHWGNGYANRDNAVADGEPSRQWTLEALKELEWKRFELLSARYYQIMGFKSETLRCGADGGIDIKLFHVDPSKPIAIVQCKAWNSSQVGVAPVRELLGVMTSEKVARGIFLTTSTFTRDAVAFAEANPIKLLDGPGFLKKIQDLPEAARLELLSFAFAGDYSTPTCASCSVKMIRRESKRGPLWGCVNYPRCKCHFAIKR